MCWPPGHRLDIFKDPTEPERYTTNPYCARIPSNMFRLESTDVSKPTNSAQKPIALIRRILDFATEPGSVILDVTCGHRHYSDDGHATEENEQAEANEDVANPVGEDDEEE
eukprot:jgi/Tetstr1/446474/TSEL_034015.t1